MLADDNRNTLYQDYTATCMGMIGRLLARENWELPPFVDMVYPDYQKPNDFRTKDEIIRDLSERLSEHGRI